MTYTISSLLFALFSIFITLLLIFFAYSKWCHTHFQKRGITTIPPTFLFGNIGGVLTQKESMGIYTLRLYRYLRKKKLKFGGSYFMLLPQFVPVDLGLVKSILMTDFDHFVDRGIYFNEECDPLSANLFSLEGAKWRILRAKLTPTFTSGKMKMMFDTLVKCGEEMKELFGKLEGRPIDVTQILLRFTTDVIGSCAFGIECNTLKNQDNEFARYGKLVFEGTNIWLVVMFCCFVFPNFMKMINMPMIDPRASKFFDCLLRKTIEYRENNCVYRKDFLQLLLQMKRKSSSQDVNGDLNLTLEEIEAQAFLFFLAGFETSSAAMTFCLYELACNQDVQESVRKEVCQILEKYGDTLTYEAITEMNYLDKTVNETLRKYPPLPFLNRVCTKDYKIPNTSLTIKKGEKVLIPVLGIHRDEEYYPNPEKFDPERFSEENKRKRPSCSFIPFGEGPRICLGLRFGLMQAKVGLAILIKNYRFSVSSKTIQPPLMSSRSYSMVPDGGLWLDCVRI